MPRQLANMVPVQGYLRPVDRSGARNAPRQCTTDARQRMRARGPDTIGSAARTSAPPRVTRSQHQRKKTWRFMPHA